MLADAAVKGSPIAGSPMPWLDPGRRKPYNIESCNACGGAAKVIAGVEAPAVIGKLARHLPDS